jgi:hypothetical protein
VGGPAETSFGVHNPGESAIIIEIELFNSMDGADVGMIQETIHSAALRRHRKTC